ncbi:hypothetical protein J6590_098460 [Homalodisca vitripennis]|nr:hypothetical protein J6590_097572 [Homalodisca vitripennis]KAG8261515.1 hypothetical protein J6590_070919 [Homalodisca vitripennis]KAG8319104.1 hypothetical protein J6590_098460 [Homalodisca vitripennis]
MPAMGGRSTEENMEVLKKSMGRVITSVIRVKRRLPHQNTTIQSEMAAHNVLHNVYLKQPAISDWINLLRCGLRYSTLLSELFQMSVVNFNRVLVLQKWSLRIISGRRRFETLAGLVGYELCYFVKSSPKLFVSNRYYHQYPTRSRELISVAAHSTSAF